MIDKTIQGGDARFVLKPMPLKIKLQRRTITVIRTIKILHQPIEYDDIVSSKKYALVEKGARAAKSIRRKHWVDRKFPYA